MAAILFFSPLLHGPHSESACVLQILSNAVFQFEIAAMDPDLERHHIMLHSSSLCTDLVRRLGPPYQVTPMIYLHQDTCKHQMTNSMTVRGHYAVYVIDQIQKHIPKGALICTVYICEA